MFSKNEGRKDARVTSQNKTFLANMYVVRCKVCGEYSLFGQDMLHSVGSSATVMPCIALPTSLILMTSSYWQSAGYLVMQIIQLRETNTIFVQNWLKYYICTSWSVLLNNTITFIAHQSLVWVAEFIIMLLSKTSTTLSFVRFYTVIFNKCRFLWFVCSLHKQQKSHQCCFLVDESTNRILPVQCLLTAKGSLSSAKNYFVFDIAPKTFSTTNFIISQNLVLCPYISYVYLFDMFFFHKKWWFTRLLFQALC